MNNAWGLGRSGCQKNPTIMKNGWESSDFHWHPFSAEAWVNWHEIYLVLFWALQFAHRTPHAFSVIQNMKALYWQMDKWGLCNLEVHTYIPKLRAIITTQMKWLLRWALHLKVIDRTLTLWNSLYLSQHVLTENSDTTSKLCFVCHLYQLYRFLACMLQHSLLGQNV